MRPTSHRENCEMWPSAHIAGIASFCWPSRAMLARFTSPIGSGGTSAPATRPARGQPASSDTTSRRNRVWLTSTALPASLGSNAFAQKIIDKHYIYIILPTVTSTNEHINITIQRYRSTSPNNNSKSDRKSVKERA